jgi:hypothetical protein
MLDHAPTDRNGVSGILRCHVQVLGHPLDRIGCSRSSVGVRIRELSRHATKLEHVQFALSISLIQPIKELLSVPPARNCATASAHNWIVATDGFGDNLLNS